MASPQKKEAAAPASSSGAQRQGQPRRSPRQGGGSGRSGDPRRRHGGRGDPRSGGGGGRPRGRPRAGTLAREQLQQKLASMGSYSKYLHAIEHSPFEVKIRCACNRSRTMSWMFVCTYCATGTYSGKSKSGGASSALGGAKGKIGSGSPDGSSSSSSSSSSSDDSKGVIKIGSNPKNRESNASGIPMAGLDKDGEIEKIEPGELRDFLCCDMCAYKETGSYLCPHCLTAYSAQYVKQYTRCPRCVACPICTSHLEKLVYAFGPSSKDKEKDTKKTDEPSEKQGDDKPDDGGTDSGGGKKEDDKSDDKKKSRDTYLYQCPFCFWSSDTVNLRASEGQELLNNLTQMIKRPRDASNNAMDQLLKRYKKMNRDLLDEISRGNPNHLRSGFGGGPGTRFGRTGPGGTTGMGTGKKTGRTRNGFKRMDSNGGAKAVKQDPVHAIQSLEAKLSKKWDLNGIQGKKEANNSHIQGISMDDPFVSRFSLKNIAPLSHRLDDPLRQSYKFNEHLPQKVHLSTKESFKCPYKHCNAYVCKPTLRGRGANYDVRTAVLDLLPRVSISVVSGGLLTTTSSKILIHFFNRHSHVIQLSVDPSINAPSKSEKHSDEDGKSDKNEAEDDDEDDDGDDVDDLEDEDDPFITVTNVTCSRDTFHMDPSDIHIRKDMKMFTETKSNGDYSKGKEVGIHLSFKPKLYEPTDIKFSLRVNLATQLQYENEEKRKGPLKKVELPYILDFNLGHSRKPQVHPAPGGGGTGSGANAGGKSVPAGLGASIVPGKTDGVDMGVARTSTMQVPHGIGQVTRVSSRIAIAVDVKSELTSGQTKSRGSNEFKRKQPENDE